MNIENKFAIYFSPTGNTKRAALTLAKALGDKVREIDLSIPDAQERAFAAGDAAVFAVPVFGGRIPACLVKRLQTLQGNGAAAATAAVYGNRAYEDALLELNETLQAQGFRVTASAALVAEHSMLRAVAAGRPDAQDVAEMKAFMEQVCAKLSGGILGPVSVPGNRPYKEYSPAPAVPTASADACTGCGVCVAQCPVEAIPVKQPHTADAAKCIRCMRCAAVCPVHARALPAAMCEMLEQKLGPLKAVRRENEFFL